MVEDEVEDDEDVVVEEEDSVLLFTGLGDSVLLSELLSALAGALSLPFADLPSDEGLSPVSPSDFLLLFLKSVSYQPVPLR